MRYIFLMAARQTGQLYTRSEKARRRQETCLHKPLVFEDSYSKVIHCTGHVSAASWQLQVLHLSGPITCALPSSPTLKTSGHISSHVPHPSHASISTTGFGISFPPCFTHEFLFLKVRMRSRTELSVFLFYFILSLLTESIFTPARQMLKLMVFNKVAFVCPDDSSSPQLSHSNPSRLSPSLMLFRSHSRLVLSHRQCTALSH